MAQIKVTRRGRIAIDQQAAVKAVEPVILAHMRARTERGLDALDRPLPAYSPLYRQQLAAIGADVDVDARQSGALMRALKLLRIEIRAGVARIIFGVDAGGTSPRQPRPPPWVFAGTAAQNADALERWRRSPKKPERSLPHGELLALLQRGNGRTPARLLLGISPRGRAEVIRALMKARVFRS